MKLKNCLTLSRFNLKGSKRKNTVLIMMVLSVIMVIVLAGFLIITTEIMEQHENKPVMHQVVIFPESRHSESSHKGVNEETLDEVLNIDHVLSCDIESYPDYQFIDITKIIDENGNDITNSSEEFQADILSNSIYEQEVDEEFYINSYIGQQLKDAPAMSCILPDIAYRLDNSTRRYVEVETSGLLGKTLTVNCDYTIHNYTKNELGGYEGEYITASNITYDLKVVGLYHYSNESALTGLTDTLISSETAKKIDKMALDKAKEEIPKEINTYITDPYARDSIVYVDDHKNVDAVVEALNELGYSSMSCGMINPSVTTFTSIFSGAGTFLLVAIILLTVIILFLSVYSNINERKAEIGLMKAVGYNSGQIFKSMYLENVILALKAFLIGGAISVIIVIAINLINLNSGDLMQISYVMSWSSFLVLAVVALLLILIIPLICLLIMTALIAKIPPQEAMNS